MTALYICGLIVVGVGIFFADDICEFFEVGFWEWLLFVMGLGFLAGAFCYKLGLI